MSGSIPKMEQQQQRPKRKCAEAVRAVRAAQSANLNEDSDDSADEASDSDSDGADAEWVQTRNDGEEDEEDDGKDEEDEDEDEDEEDVLPESRWSMSEKIKREVYKALADDLGMDTETMRKGVSVMRAALHAGPWFLARVYKKVDEVDGAAPPAAAHGSIRAVVVDLFGLFGGVAEIASDWANPAVDKLAAVLGGGAVHIFRDLTVWSAALRTYVALRLASVISKAGCVNMALQTGLQREGTLQMLAAKQFLETAAVSIRGEVGSEPKGVARTILSELAEQYELHKTLRSARAKRSRAVDMTPPKGFARRFGAASNIADKTLLHVVIVGPQGRIASVVSNERYGSKPISMGTAAREALRLLEVAPLTRDALKEEVAPDSTICMSMTAAYAGDQTSKCVRFGTTKHGQRRTAVECVRFKRSDLRKVLAVRKYAQTLFSPHYDVSRKGRPLAVLKITLSACAFRPSNSKSINDLMRMTADGADGADGKKKRKRG